MAGKRQPVVRRLNLGCGPRKLDGWINVDLDDTFGPDIAHDLESFPWPLRTSAFDEILLNHVLEHIGQVPGVFLGIMKELYRVARADALVRINSPHPNHDDFHNDPTHVRAITPELLSLFDRDLNETWQKMGAANSRLALYTGTHFKLQSTEVTPDPRFRDESGKLRVSLDELMTRSRIELNVIKEYRMVVKVIKLPGA